MREPTVTTGELWTRFARDLSAYFRRRIPDAQDVEDLLQETFVRIHAGLPALRSQDRLSVWLYRVARSVLEDHRRRAPRTLPLADDESIADGREESDSTLNREVGAWARLFLEVLPPEYRDAVRMADVEGLPQAEIARALGLSVSGAKSRVQRGRAMVRTALLNCCHVDFDRRGNVLETRPRVPCDCHQSQQLVTIAATPRGP